MEIYTLDTNFKRVHLIDEYESFIWTERYNEAGDFKLVVRPELVKQGKIYLNRYIAHSESDRVMIVDQLLTKRTADGVKVLEVTGHSYEYFFKYRSINRRRAGAGIEGEFRQSGTVNSVVTTLVNYEVVQGFADLGDYNQNDVIPTLYTAGLADSSIDTHLIVNPQSLYDAVKEYCDPYGVGFRIQLMSDRRLRFSVYTGVVRPNVVFSPQLDTLSEDSFLAQCDNWYSVAYVWAKDNLLVHSVARRGQSREVTGLQRRVLTVNASKVDISKHTEQDVLNDLTWYGWKALAQRNKEFVYDGKVTDKNPFKYRVHYNLGDTVKLLDEEESFSSVMVSEYIWSSDTQGFRSYPTFVNPLR